MKYNKSLFCRKQLVFKATGSDVIDYNINHEVMKNCYYYMSISDDVLSKFLHNEGYKAESGHVYKLFNFATIFQGVNFTSKGIEIDENSQLKVILSGKEEIVKKIIKGLLHAKKIKLFDLEFSLQNIEDDKQVRFNNIMLYKTLSPVVETSKNDELKSYFLTVYDRLYYINLIENAKRKYKLIYGEDFNGKFFFDIDDIDSVKEKSYAVNGIYNRGYLYNMWVQTTPKMQRIIYYLGLGQNSSLGAGCLSFITSRSEDAA